MPRTKRDKRSKKRKAAGSARFRERSRGRGADLFNLPEGVELFNIESTGTFNLDILPYEVGEGNPNAEEGDSYWERGFWIHRNIGVNDEWVVCPAQTLKKPCPICEFRARMADDPDVDEKVIDAFKPSERMIMNVRNLKKESDKVMVWHISFAYFGDAMQQALSAEYEDEEENMDFFFEAQDGYYCKCQSEKGWQGRGFEITRVDFRERKKDLEDDILDKAVCLDEILRIRDYDELKELLMGGMSDEEEEDKPPKGRRGRKRTDDDEEEEKKSSRKRRGKSSKKKETEDDLDDMDKDDLIDLMKEKGLSVKGYRKMEEDELRDAVREALEEAEEAEKDESDEPNIDDDIDLMDYDELVDYMKREDLSIKGYKKMDEDELREAIEKKIKPKSGRRSKR